MAGYRIERPETAFSKQGASKTERIDDPQHRAWIRKLPCVRTGKYGCDCAHVNFANIKYGSSGRGKGKRAGDDYTLPLHPEVHRSQHDTNEKEWWAATGMDPHFIATKLYSMSLDTENAIQFLEQQRKDAAR